MWDEGGLVQEEVTGVGFATHLAANPKLCDNAETWNVPS